MATSKMDVGGEISIQKKKINPKPGFYDNTLERISLCCSLINVLSALKHILDNTDETKEQSNIIELTDSSSSIETIVSGVSSTVGTTLGSIFRKNMIPKKSKPHKLLFLNKI